MYASHTDANCVLVSLLTYWVAYPVQFIYDIENIAIEVEVHGQEIGQLSPFLGALAGSIKEIVVIIDDSCVHPAG